MALKNLAERQQTAVQTDHENDDWTRDAADNPGALTAKQRYERRRIDRHYDLHLVDIDDACERIAARLGTSKSQVASWLLARALVEYIDGNNELEDTMVDARKPARTLKFEWALTLPRRWVDTLKQFVMTGAIDGRN